MRCSFRTVMSSSLTALAIAGCDPAGDSTGRAEPSVEADTIDGVVHVVNRGMPPDWQLVHLLALGSQGTLGEARPDEFGRISSITIGPQERLYVADQYYSEVRAFDLDGEFLFAFGRNGGGPGEFGSLYSLAWIGDTLLALDLGNGRIGELDSAGFWLGQRRHPGRISGSPAELRLYRTAWDEVYAWSLEASESGVQRVFVRHTPAGAEGRLELVRRQSGPPGGFTCETPDGGISFFDIPFTPKLIQRPARGRTLAAAWTEDYRIAFLRSESDTVRVVERVADPVPVSDAEWEAGLEEYRAFTEERQGESCRPRSIAKPEHKPPIVDFHLDWTGRLWVEAATPQGTVWEIFDPEGRLIGRLPAVPRADRVAPYFGPDHLGVVTRDSLDVQSVQVYRFGPGHERAARPGELDAERNDASHRSGHGPDAPNPQKAQAQHVSYSHRRHRRLPRCSHHCRSPAGGPARRRADDRGGRLAGRLLGDVGGRDHGRGELDGAARRHDGGDEPNGAGRSDAGLRVPAAQREGFGPGVPGRPVGSGTDRVHLDRAGGASGDVREPAARLPTPDHVPPRLTRFADRADRRWHGRGQSELPVRALHVREVVGQWVSGSVED